MTVFPGRTFCGLTLFESESTGPRTVLLVLLLFTAVDNSVAVSRPELTSGFVPLYGELTDTVTATVPLAPCPTVPTFHVILRVVALKVPPFVALTKLSPWTSESTTVTPFRLTVPVLEYASVYVRLLPGVSPRFVEVVLVSEADAFVTVTGATPIAGAKNVDPVA